MRAPHFIIQIAADSVQRLRSVDLARVFDTCTDEELKPTADYILANRPELAAKVETELDYQNQERRAMKIKIELELSHDVSTVLDVAETIRKEFKSFADKHDPLGIAERGPFFHPTTGRNIGTWQVVE